MSLLPTPTVNDARNLSAPSQEDRNGPGLPTVVRLLPTPDASVANYGEEPETFLARQAELKEEHGNGNGVGTPLTIAVKLLPTPTSASYEQGGTAAEQTEIKRGLGLLSPGGSTSPRSDAGKPSTGPRPTLSPDFVGWMMGTPQCTVCGAEWTDPACQHSATAYTSTPPGSSEPTS